MIRDAGGVILDTSELLKNGINQATAQQLGEALTEGSRGTLVDAQGKRLLGEAAVAEAAKRSGVTTYTDWQDLGLGEEPKVIGKSFDYTQLHDWYTGILGR